MASLRSGADAVEHHRQVLRQNPRLRDAELTIGLYDYIIGSLPLPLKLVVGSFGVRGSKKRGLQTLETVAREGRWARDVALVLLVDLYKREKRWTDAVSVSRALASRYESNYLFKLQLADALSNAQSTNNGEVVGIFEELLKDRRLEPSAIDLIHFRYGETLLSLGDSSRALTHFQRLLSRKTADPALKSLSHLRFAQCLDLLGKRPEAVAEYRTIVANSSEASFKDEAKQGIKQPYRATRP